MYQQVTPAGGEVHTSWLHQPPSLVPGLLHIPRCCGCLSTCMQSTAYQQDHANTALGLLQQLSTLLFASFTTRTPTIANPTTDTSFAASVTAAQQLMSCSPARQLCTLPCTRGAPEALTTACSTRGATLAHGTACAATK
jgi:hypothetical protein